MKEYLGFSGFCLSAYYYYLPFLYFVLILHIALGMGLWGE